MLLNISCSLAIFGNTPKVDTKATMNKNKMENKKRSWVQCLHFQNKNKNKKKKKNMISN